jgi:hypothetical protein
MYCPLLSNNMTLSSILFTNCSLNTINLGKSTKLIVWQSLNNSRGIFEEVGYGGNRGMRIAIMNRMGFLEGSISDFGCRN